MKNALVFAAALGLLGASSPVQAAGPVLWQGSVTITSNPNLNTSCTRYRFGQVGSSVFAPKLSALGARSRLAIFFEKRALYFEETNTNSGPQMQGTGLLATTYIGDLADMRTGALDQTQYNFTVTPSTITAHTPSVTIVGYIWGAFPTQGCSLAISGFYTLLPTKTVIVPPPAL